VLAAAVLLTALLGLTNAILGVNPPRLDALQTPITPNTLKPGQCAGITVANLIASNGGTVTGTAANDLILGGPAAQTIRGGAGNDCILGGGSGNNQRSTLDGDSTAGEPVPPTTDVCLVQAGTRVRYLRCEITGTYP
jgi:hypothetical protein